MPHVPVQADTWQRKATLTLAALGVVYGDIGTSPLYAVRQSALAAGEHIAIQSAIMGVVSLIVWSLIIVVTLKYVLLIMRADNDGEGGILALASLAHRTQGLDRRVKVAIGTAAILGLALFFGDGMLTPAISVLSAVEGLSVESKTFEPLVVPLSLAILIGLFVIQSRGTARVGRLFGPVMVLWFIVIGALGFVAIIRTPHILWALSPYYGLLLFVREPWTAFVSLGSVVLAVTGCETLYADMGHFGKFPIRIAWLAFVFPALVLNYFGQGAALLRDPSKADVAFYAVAPHWAHYPLVFLATIAAIIASQAVISGVYSITRQAVQLGQLPRMEIRHTSATDYGQIYVPRMNAYLCTGVVLIVLIFKSSNALATAYGIAVTGIMVLSTVLVGIVAVRQWHWKMRVVIPVFGLLALIDLAFLSSNALKISEGGWLPLFIAAFVYVVMETWRLGRRAHLDRIRNESMPLELFLERAEKTPVRVAGTAVFLTARADAVPSALLHNLKHNKVLHERVIVVQVMVDDTPFVPPDKRIEVEKLGKGFFSVHIHHGFFETPDVPHALTEARPYGLAVDPETTTFFIGRETLVPADNPVLGRWRTWLYMQLASNALSPVRFYHLPPNRVVELGTQITI
ncbi:MAG: potassium transporter Kup [Alphaproteobacteria bacterium]|nr:potassium transporter Kup [Alphaproteobacteria bacterium]MDE1987694.1 potassium transporter Kup [Alphaproteobacteria bacterium]MDE2264840.1 potassium transporter Kup [Alphaproteobacteria bacterium]MDE2499746.1 potassium transporter Kup [Alphaproteobacteria bacterium]